MKRKKGVKPVKPAIDFTWRISGSFAFQNKTYSIGEPVPRFIPTTEREDLFKNGKLVKIYTDGKVVKFKPPFTASQDDINLFLSEPSLIFQYLERFDISEESLKEIMSQGSKLGMDESYLKELRQSLKEKTDG
jgi:hypothetical protein